MKPAVITVAAAVAFGGCSYQLVSPPARMVALETARTARPGETVAGVKGAAHAAVFDPGAAVATAGVRHGVADGVELDADATWAYVVEPTHQEIDRNIYAGRAGIKMSNQRGWAAVLGGVGGGYSPAAGNFAAVDAGVAFSHPNCYLVPFVGSSVFYSIPFDSKRVDFRREDGTIFASDTADTTYGFATGAGLEIPLDRSRCREGRTPAHIQLGVSATTLIPSDGAITTTTTSTVDGGTITETSTRGGRYGALGAAVGVEFPF